MLTMTREALIGQQLPSFADTSGVILEMGHIYLYPSYLGRPDTEIVTHEEVLGAQIGLEVYGLLAECGFPVQSMLFVDDLHGNPLTGEEGDQESERRIQSVLEKYQKIGFVPDRIVSEADMTPAAAHLYSMMVMRGILSGSEKHLPKPYAQSLLYHRLDDESREPSCSLIDAALYKKKLGAEKQRATITVLPETYQAQQKQVKNILQAVGDYFPAITILYFSPDGGITVDNWGANSKT